MGFSGTPLWTWDPLIMVSFRTHTSFLLFPNPTPIFESLKIWEAACMGPEASHNKGVPCPWGSLGSSPLILDAALDAVLQVVQLLQGPRSSGP